jgi:hypothetical protein
VPLPVYSPGQSLPAADVNSWLLPVVVVKAADQFKTSTTVLANDSELFVPVAAGCTYLFDCYLDYEGGVQGASDLQMQWTVPAGALLRYQPVGTFSSGVQHTGETNVAGTNFAPGTNGAGVLRGITMRGTLVVAGTSGNLQLQWAQNTSSATATIVHAMSYVKLQRVG